MGELCTLLMAPFTQSVPIWEVLGVRQQASHPGCCTPYRLLVLEAFQFIRCEKFIYDLNEVKKNSHLYANQKKQV